MSFFKNVSDMFEKRAEKSQKTADEYAQKAANSKNSNSAAYYENISKKYEQGAEENRAKAKEHKGKEWK